MILAQLPFKTLYQNKWLELRETSTGYVYVYSPWDGGRGAAILVYKEDTSAITSPDEDNPHRLYLARYEVCPAHGDEYEITSIAGGMDKAGEHSYQCAVRELEEEGGIKLSPDADVKYLGHVRSSKTSANYMYLYSVRLTDTNHTVVEILGDGTPTEEGAYCKWLTEQEYIDQCNDPIVCTMLLRNQYVD